jgi:hypothetical protein
MNLVSEPAMDWFSAVRSDIDAGVLAPIVRDSLGISDAMVAAFEVRPIDYTNVDPDRRLLARVTGDAAVGDRTLPWSLVLKAFRRPADPDSAAALEPTHYEYWEREPRFFESTMPASLGPGLRSVRCHGVERRGVGEVWVWLEDLAADREGHWGSETFQRVAEDLGRFAGTFVASRPVPRALWLADTWSVQVQYSFANPWIREPIMRALEGPPSTGLASANAFGTARDRAILHDAFLRQDLLLEAVDRLPRAICHNDTLATNLFPGQSASGQSETAAIDWALVGIGPAGGDLGQLVAGSACFFKASTDELDLLDRLSFEAYLGGMADAGANVPSADIRFASLVTVLAQWSAIVAYHLANALDPSEEEQVAAFWHRPAPEVVEQLTPLLAFLTRRAEETLELANRR